MSSGVNSDIKLSTGLASCYSNIFKLTEVTGLKWMVYIGPSSCVSPASDPVLMSYAELLSQGYACAWRKLLAPVTSKSGSVTDTTATATANMTNGGEEMKDLWIFHYSELPDLSASVSSELRDGGGGSWEEGMSTEATGMYFRALRNLSERTLFGENFLTLGKWFAQTDHTGSNDNKACVLYSFSYFIHAHRYVCATVDVQSAPNLYPLTASLLSEATASQDGLQVLLSPSGINAVLTGHSYGATEEGIRELLDEWKLFFPQRFAASSSSNNLPAAVEVVVGGARMKYPSQFLLVFYTGSTPPSLSSVHNTFPGCQYIPQSWQDDLKGFEYQKTSHNNCNCKALANAADHSSKSATIKTPHLQAAHQLLKVEPLHVQGTKQTIVELPLQPKKEFPPPMATSTSSNFPSASKYHKKHVPKYTAPFPSPTTSQPTSPVIRNEKKSSTGGHSNQPLLSSSTSKQVKGQIYDLNKMAGAIASSNSATTEGSGRKFKSLSEGWWNCLSLPFSNHSALVGTYTIGSVSGSLGDPSVFGGGGGGGGFTHDVSLPNLTLPTSMTLNNNVTATLSPRIASPTNVSPLGASKNRTTSASSKTNSNRTGSNSDKRGRKNSTCGSPRQPKSARSKGGSISKRDRVTSMIDLGPSVMGSPLDTENFTPGFLSSTSPFSFTPVGSTSDIATQDIRMMDTMMSQSVMQSICKPDGHKLCKVESEQIQSGEITIEKVDSFNNVSYPSMVDQKMGTNNKSTANEDYRSVKALEITDIDLEHIFDEEEEYDQDPDKLTKPPDIKGAGIKLPTSTSVTMPSNISVTSDQMLSELARMFPTPPSVELSHSVDDKPSLCDSQTVERMDVQHSETTVSSDHEAGYVPTSFSPLADLPSNKLYPIPDCYFYTQMPPPPSSDTTSADGKSLNNTNSAQSKPSHFVFPPPSQLPSAAISRNQRISTLTLQLVSAQSPRSSLTPLLSSPAVSRSQRFYKHVSSCTNTPVDSPIVIDSYTPTLPISQRLTPVLPEVHGLFVNLVLLESSFTDGLSDATSPYMNMGPMPHVLNRQFRLDSVSTIGDMAYPPVEFSSSHASSSTSPYYPATADVSPLLMPTTVDTVTLGFEEDCRLHDSSSLSATTAAGASAGGGTFNSLSYDEHGLLNEDALSLLQDICVQCVFAGLEWSGLSTGSDNSQSDCLQKTLYSPQCLLSALRTARKLTQAKQSRTLLSNGKNLSQIDLTKGDNSAVWLKQLSSLSTKLLIKKLRELKPLFVSIFHNTSSFKCSPKGPLSLQEFYQFTPGQGEDGFPLLMQPLLVGFEQDWITVSPLAMFAWDKLMLEPYATQKDILYVIACPNDVNVIGEAKQFFNELSITYELCQLGKHWALVKNVGEAGVMTFSPNDVAGSFQNYCKKLLGPFLSSLPTNGNTLYGYTRRPSNEVCPQLSLTSTQQLELPSAIVIYFVMDGNATDLLQSFATMISEQAMPTAIKQRLHLQPIPRHCLKKDSQWNNSSWLKSLAFATFNQCRLHLEAANHSPSMSGITSSQKDLDRIESITSLTSLYTPVSVLSPEKPLLIPSLATTNITNKTVWVMNNEAELLLCAYCVSHDQKWLLATFCDRNGELLSTAVIGIHPVNSVPQITSRFLALEKLWMHCISLMSTSVLKWNIIITRLGQPSSSEINDWPIIVNADDGLITANQLLTGRCEACETRTCKKPSLANFLLLSLQPEHNIQVLATKDHHSVSLSHVIVLPPDPNAVTSGSVTTPVATDFSADDMMVLNPADSSAAGDMGGMDTDVLLNDLNEIQWDVNIFQDDGQIQTIQGIDANLPQATAYIFSVIPPGPLPKPFWQDKQYSSTDQHQFCSIFKVLYHSHVSFSEVSDNPQDTLSSVLACFDGLSWLNMDQITGQRKSCLPIHICILSQLYRLIQSLSVKAR